MRGIRGGSVVLKRSVMRNIIALRTHDRRGRLAIAPGAAVGVHDVQVEASGEPTPSDASGVEQVADILSAHLRGAAAGADIAKGIRVPNHRVSAVPVADKAAGTAGIVHDAVGLARNQINSPDGGRAEVGAIGVVAHGVVW